MTYATYDMKQFQMKNAQENFERIFEDVLVSGGPIKILKDTGNALLVSKEVLPGMTETLGLVAIPGMRGSIRSGMREPIADSAKDLDW